MLREPDCTGAMQQVAGVFGDQAAHIQCNARHTPSTQPPTTPRLSHHQAAISNSIPHTQHILHPIALSRKLATGKRGEPRIANHDEVGRQSISQVSRSLRDSQDSQDIIYSQTFRAGKKTTRACAVCRLCLRHAEPCMSNTCCPPAGRGSGGSQHQAHAP